MSDSLLRLSEGLLRLEDSLLRLADRLVDNPIFELSARLYFALLLSGKTQKSIKILPEAP